MTMLFLVTACAGPKPGGETASQVETSETAVDSDTGQDSAESPDTVETADTSETTETGETEDTNPTTEWNPGDDVPGWADADCTEEHPGRTYVTTLPDVFAVQGTFLTGMPGVGPQLVGVRLRDCAAFPCAADALDLAVPYILADLDATRGDDAQVRGLGEWGPNSAGAREVLAEGRSALMDFTNGAGDFATASISVCVERMRPDEVRGAIRAEVFARNFPYGGFDFYNSLVYRFPFSVRFPDHAGFDATRPDEPADLPEGYAAAHYVYEQSYAEAWPWDDITDPSIREQLYERYSPYNGI